MSKLFQIYEEDLSELEKILPQLAQVMMPTLDNKTRVQLRRVKTILSHVRWDYGPPSEVEIVPAEEGDQSS